MPKRPRTLRSALRPLIAALLLSGLAACASRDESVREAFTTYRSALERRDRVALRAVVSKDKMEMLDGPEAEVAVEMIASMSPASPEFKAITVKGDEAVIELEAEDAGQVMTGTVTLVREDGAWKIAKEDWSMTITGFGSGDWAARILESPDARPRQSLRWDAHDGAVTCLAYVPDGSALVSVGYDDMAVRLWTPDNGEVVDEVWQETRPTDLAIRPDGSEALVADAQGNVTAYPIGWDGLGEPRRLPVSTGSTARLALSADGALLATAGFQAPADLWRLSDNGRERRLSASNNLRGLAFSPRGRLLAAGTAGNAFVLYDLDAKNPFGARKEFTIPKVDRQSDVSAVAFSPDGKKLLTGHMDSSITLWSVESGKQIHNFFVQDASTYDVAFAPDGTLFATAQQNGSVYLWQAETAKKLAGLKGHQGAATAIAFSPLDRESMVSGGEDGMIVTWK